MTNISLGNSGFSLMRGNLYTKGDRDQLRDSRGGTMTRRGSFHYDSPLNRKPEFAIYQGTNPVFNGDTILTMYAQDSDYNIAGFEETARRVMCSPYLQVTEGSDGEDTEAVIKNHDPEHCLEMHNLKKQNPINDDHIHYRTPDVFGSLEIAKTTLNNSQAEASYNQLQAMWNQLYRQAPATQNFPAEAVEDRMLRSVQASGSSSQTSSQQAR